MMKHFTVTKRSATSVARGGRLVTAHGVLQTPAFMPIATRAAVKTLLPEDLRDLGAEIVLSNTYHNLLRPGMTIMKKAGGLHQFMRWPGPILTDSGGYQVFSLAKMRKITPGGVTFQSHIDGSRHTLTPTSAIRIQETLGSDVMMVLDVCPPSTALKGEVEDAVIRTTAWAKMCKKAARNKKQLLFGIIQGGIYKDLRKRSAGEIVGIGFDGYAVGGLAVGEPAPVMYDILDYTVPLLPSDAPHYLMGVGTPENIVESVKRGIDLFDCVLPTRNARHGLLYVWKKKNPQVMKHPASSWYDELKITNARYANDFHSLDPYSIHPIVRQTTRAYLHHLFKTEEPLALRIATLCNLGLYLELMCRIRGEI